VSHDVSTCWFVGVSEKLGGVCLNLICNYYRQVKGFCQSQKLVELAVEYLLAFGKVFSTYVFASKVADHGVYNDEFYVVFWTKTEEMVCQQTLMAAVVSSSEKNVS